MSELIKYTFEDEASTESTYTTMDIAEAIEYGSKYELAVISNTYEWEDSEVIANYLPSNTDIDELVPTTNPRATKEAHT